MHGYIVFQHIGTLEGGTQDISLSLADISFMRNETNTSLNVQRETDATRCLNRTRVIRGNELTKAVLRGGRLPINFSNNTSIDK